mgnify:FL=1
MVTKGTRCIRVNVKGSYPIELFKVGPEDLTVVYGKDVKLGLDYNEAASRLGSCIMHALACAGKLDAETE